MFLFRHENSLNLEFYNKVHGPKYADEPYLLVSTALVNCKTATLKLVIHLFIFSLVFRETVFFCFCFVSFARAFCCIRMSCAPVKSWHLSQSHNLEDQKLVTPETEDVGLES